MSLATHIQAQIAAAQTEAEKVFHEDQQPIDLDSRKICVGRDFEINVSAPGTIVTTEIVSKRPAEGPKLGGETKQSGSPVHAPSGIESWGKPNRR